MQRHQEIERHWNPRRDERRGDSKRFKAYNNIIVAEPQKKVQTRSYGNCQLLHCIENNSYIEFATLSDDLIVLKGTDPERDEERNQVIHLHEARNGIFCAPGIWSVHLQFLLETCTLIERAMAGFASVVRRDTAHYFNHLKM